MHKFSTASPPSSALTVLHSVGLLRVPCSTLAGAWATRLVRPALSSVPQMKATALRDAAFI